MLSFVRPVNVLPKSVRVQLWLCSADTADYGCHPSHQGVRHPADRSNKLSTYVCKALRIAVVGSFFMSRNIVIAAAATTTMGHPTTPSEEAAPAYDEHMFSHDEHSVHTHPPSGSASGYATVPQHEPDIELAHNHPAPVNPFTTHQHCETCDALTSAREVRRNERHCCLWVSIVFMTFAVATMLLGIVAVDAKFKHDKN